VSRERRSDRASVGDRRVWGPLRRSRPSQLCPASGKRHHRPTAHGRVRHGARAPGPSPERERQGRFGRGPERLEASEPPPLLLPWARGTARPISGSSALAARPRADVCRTSHVSLASVTRPCHGHRRSPPALCRKAQPTNRSCRSSGLAVGLIMLTREGARKRASGSAGRRSSMVGDPLLARLVELDQGCLELTERLEPLREAVVEIGRRRSGDYRLQRRPGRGPGVPDGAHGAAKDLRLMPKHRVLKLELADVSAPTQDPDQPNKKEVDQRQHCVRDASEPRRSRSESVLVPHTVRLGIRGSSPPGVRRLRRLLLADSWKAPAHIGNSQVRVLPRSQAVSCQPAGCQDGGSPRRLGTPGRAGTGSGQHHEEVVARDVRVEIDPAGVGRNPFTRTRRRLSAWIVDLAVHHDQPIPLNTCG
jgi:hypothetical protein